MIVVGTTLTTFAVLDPERSFLWDAWLRHAEEISESVDDAVRYFVAIQLDARGLAPFAPLLARLEQVGGTYWTYTLDDGRDRVTQANRLRHITFGQNLISEYANAMGATHMLHMAADCEPPADVLPQLLAVHNGLAAAFCPTYGLRGDSELAGYPFPVTGPNTRGGPPFAAVCVLLEREIFKRVKWRYDTDMGFSDDPAMAYDAETLFDVPVRIRTDCIARHWPECINEIENRFPGLDMSVQR